MKRKVLVIGIGAGDPDHLTVQAIEALNRADVLFIPDKGTEKEDLARIRREICARFIRDPGYRAVAYTMPARERAGDDYLGGVEAWHGEIAAIFGRLLAEELGEEQWGAFLVWGDPALYDSTLRILDRLRARGDLELDYEVIPGISAAQALAARHATALNSIGGAVAITTGRRLAAGMPADADSVVVMLDGQTAFASIEEDVDIWWGAYLGTADEILVAGRLRDVAGDIARIRAEARKDKGWIMDTYLVRRRGPA